jgi:Phage integrase family.
VAQI